MGEASIAVIGVAVVMGGTAIVLVYAGGKGNMP